MHTRPVSRRVWVWPNRNALGLAAVLLAMWYAGASQTNGAAYLLCFVLASVAAISAIHTWANLRGVTVDTDPIPPVFAGDQLPLALTIATDRHRPHFGISIRAQGCLESAFVAEVSPLGAESVLLHIQTVRRGFFARRDLVISTIFPLGFFTARRTIIVRQHHYIYPRPEGTRPLPRALAPTRQPRDGLRVAGDDFGGVRTWQQGESQRHIDWKAAARGQTLLTKQWTGDAEEILLLDWHALDGLDDETRLRQLTRWVLLAERGGASYGLRLPGKELAPARGEGHFHACLQALAVCELPEESAA